MKERKRENRRGEAKKVGERNETVEWRKKCKEWRRESEKPCTEGGREEGRKLERKSRG